jgi:hypothetical protein
MLLVAAAALAAVGLGAIELHLRHAGYSFAEVLCTFRTPSALAALLALGVAIAAPVRAIAALRRGDVAAPRSFAILGAIAAALCALATGWQVHRGHAWLTRLLPSRPWAVLDLVDGDAGVVVVMGTGAALAAALWGSAALVWARRRGAGPATLAAVAASALAAFLGAEGLVRTAAGALALHEGCYGGQPATPELRLVLLDEVNAPLAPLRLAVMIVAALGTALILALARREPASRPAPRALLLPAVVLALGVAAAALSHGLGHDVRHPPPLWHDAPTAASSGWIPAVDACPPEREIVDAPQVRRLNDGTWLVDGVRADDARDAVEALRKKRDLWKQVQPRKPFPGVAYVYAGADAPSAEIAPFIAAAREAGYPHIQGVQRLPAKHWPTRTLGDLAYAPRLCGAPLPADFAVRGTWAEALR